MKYLKKFIESVVLKDEVDTSELKEYMIDFIQMGLGYEIHFRKSIILDFSNSDYMNSDRIESLGQAQDSVEILIKRVDLKPSGAKIPIISYFNTKEFEYAYYMICDYLKSENDLVPNYIFINKHWSYVYYKDIDAIKRNIGNNFQAHTIIFSFIKNTELIHKI